MKAETKFTPGPWKLIDPATIANVVGCRVAKVFVWQQRMGTRPASAAEETANAHLIAAAPDLYAKGKRLCDVVEAFQRHGDDAVPESLRNITEADVAQALYELRDALKKARGEA